MTFLWFVLGLLGVLFLSALSVLWRIENPGQMDETWLRDEKSGRHDRRAA